MDVVSCFAKGINTGIKRSFFEAVLPIHALREESRSSGVAITNTDYLNAMVFMISNNFLNKVIRDKFDEWWRLYGNMSLLKALLSMKHSTAEALLEGLLPLAVEASDVATVRYLLRGGMSAEGKICQSSRFPDSLLSPLHYALLEFKTDLVDELIKARVKLDQPLSSVGLGSSVIVLAIIGHSMSLGAESVALLDLVKCLYCAGANINLKTHNSILSTSMTSYDAALHSPLTLASKYRQKELVAFLLANGAYINFTTIHGRSALHECIYSHLDLSHAYEIWTDRNETRSSYQQLFLGCSDVKPLLDIVHCLVEAQVDLNL
jgi:hypothetical protein